MELSVGKELNKKAEAPNICIMNTCFTLIQTFPITAQELYEAWLDSERHSAMTGGEAECSNREGDSFTAWDGYISGKNLRLTPFKAIVQSWRTTEFAGSDPDSEVLLTFRDTPKGCEMLLHHSQIPEGQPDYEKGWIDHYFEPMEGYFWERE